MCLPDVLRVCNLFANSGARLSEQCQSEDLVPTDAAGHVHIKGGVLEIVSDG